MDRTCTKYKSALFVVQVQSSYLQSFDARVEILKAEDLVNPAFVELR